jgi:glutamyl-tRNA(Gln) amidotransferase subunit E
MPEVRKCLPDGKSEFMRPMPGAARLYPETDIPSIRVDRAYLKELQLQLPELLEDKAERYIDEYHLHPEVAKQLVQSNKVSLFEYLVEWAEPRLLATTLTSTLKQLTREGVDTAAIFQEDLRAVFQALKSGAITKEVIPDALKAIAKSPDRKAPEVISKLSVKRMTEADLRKLVKELLKKNPAIKKAPRPEKALMGLVMREVRGRLPGDVVMRILAEELKK